VGKFLDRWHTDPGLWEKLKPLAREKRLKPTKAEKLLWKYLKNYQILGLKFRREHSVGPFIVDFYCHVADLVIEIDGPIHQYHPEEDAIRQQYLESKGFTLIRFTNDSVLGAVEKVISQITAFAARPV
jgi:very-short-patch-repair endonuclease